MRRLLFLFGCVIVLFALTGCQELGRDKNAVEVIVEGGGQFPDFLAGRWKAVSEDVGWEITFEPNGVISSVVIPLGGVEIRPNQITKVQGQQGEPGFFEPGDFEVRFDPKYRELSVDIKIKRVYMNMGSVAKGSCEYLIVGNVSEDGKSWQADVFTALDLHVLTPDPNHMIAGKPKLKETGRLLSDLDTEGAESFIFTRVEGAGSNE